MRPSSSGRWAPTYQSPDAGLERLNVVELCDVTGRVRDRQGLHRVALGNTDPIGFITGGAPHRIWLQKKERESLVADSKTFQKKKEVLGREVTRREDRDKEV